MKLPDFPPHYQIVLAGWREGNCILLLVCLHHFLYTICVHTLLGMVLLKMDVHVFSLNSRTNDIILLFRALNSHQCHCIPLDKQSCLGYAVYKGER